MEPFDVVGVEVVGLAVFKIVFVAKPLSETTVSVFLVSKGLFKICGVLEAKLSVGGTEYCVKSPGPIDEVGDEGVATVAVFFCSSGDKGWSGKSRCTNILTFFFITL